MGPKLSSPHCFTTATVPRRKTWGVSRDLATASPPLGALWRVSNLRALRFLGPFGFFSFGSTMCASRASLG
eukprot:960418-Pyramimonas_sp.AAC.1